MDQLTQHMLADQVHVERTSPPVRYVGRSRRSRRPRRPPPAGPSRSALRPLLRAETRLYLRDTPAAVFALAVPAVVLLGVGLAVPGMREPLRGGHWDGLTLIQAYTPAVLTMALATPALSTLPTAVASYRQQGVLRRLSVTPVRPRAVLAAQVVVNLAAFGLAAVVATVLAAVVFSAPAPRQLVTAALVLLAGAVAMFGLGLLVAARARTATTAAGVGMLLYFPLLFLAGLWTPGPLMPELARQLATYTPVGATSQALTTAWFGSGVPALQLVVLAAWAALVCPLALKIFRWS